MAKRSNANDNHLNEKIQIHIKEAERNLFQDETKRRYKMARRSKTIVTLSVALPIVYLICILLPNGLTENNTHLSFAWYLEMIGKNANTLAGVLSGQPAGTGGQFIITQYLIVALVGAALAISGSVYQGAFRNALASPTTLGIETGGVLGGMIFILLFFTDEEYGTMTKGQASGEIRFLADYGLTLFILIGCFVMVGVVLGASRILGRGKYSTLGLILSGVIFSGGIGEILGLIQYQMLQENMYDTRVYAMRFLMLGTFTKAFTTTQLVMMGIPILTGITIILLLRRKLNLLVFGEDEARTMGIKVGLIRNLTVGVVTVLTAIVITYCGM
ncbi:MAG: iron ABC transporter permease, partial [Clostridiales Family XIII bacterium]|nr:iron ABC transporter permease [Clostridiales Family XIII bacterium]